MMRACMVLALTWTVAASPCCKDIVEKFQSPTAARLERLVNRVVDLGMRGVFDAATGAKSPLRTVAVVDPPVDEEKCREFSMPGSGPFKSKQERKMEDRLSEYEWRLARREPLNKDDDKGLLFYEKPKPRSRTSDLFAPTDPDKAEYSSDRVCQKFKSRAHLYQACDDLVHDPELKSKLWNEACPNLPLDVTMTALRILDFFIETEADYHVDDIAVVSTAEDDEEKASLVVGLATLFDPDFGLLAGETKNLIESPLLNVLNRLLGPLDASDDPRGEPHTALPDDVWRKGIDAAAGDEALTIEAGIVKLAHNMRLNRRRQKEDVHIAEVISMRNMDLEAIAESASKRPRFTMSRHLQQKGKLPVNIEVRMCNFSNNLQDFTTMMSMMEIPPILNGDYVTMKPMMVPRGHQLCKHFFIPEPCLSEPEVEHAASTKGCLNEEGRAEHLDLCSPGYDLFWTCEDAYPVPSGFLQCVDGAWDSVEAACVVEERTSLPSFLIDHAALGGITQHHHVDVVWFADSEGDSDKEWWDDL